MDQRKMTEGQRAYEAKRAAKAGISLDKWLTLKAKEEAAEHEHRCRDEMDEQHDVHDEIVGERLDAVAGLFNARLPEGGWTTPPP